MKTEVIHAYRRMIIFSMSDAILVTMFQTEFFKIESLAQGYSPNW